MEIIAIGGKARHGKTTSANILKEIIENDSKSAVVLNYAGYLKYICKTYYNWNGEKDIIGRTLLQSVGDNIRNKYGNDFWVNKLLNDIKIFCSDIDYVIIDDCRYKNEILIPSSMFKTYSLYINRECFESDLTEEQKKHKSENDLNDFPFEYKISSMSGADNLFHPLNNLYNNIKKRCGE